MATAVAIAHDGNGLELPNQQENDIILNLTFDIAMGEISPKSI